MEASKKKIKAPNKKNFDDEMGILAEFIRGKEKELKSLSRPHVDTEDADVLQNELKKVRAEKETAFENRKRLDEELKKRRDNISKKQDMLTRMQGGLPYTTEIRIDEAVQKLQHQLSTQCFKLREEKRVVAEIDNLKRSKKSVREYLTLKLVLEGDRAKQKEVKDEKDLYYKSVQTLKTKEEDIKQKLESSKSKLKESESKRIELKKEIDALYEKKRGMVADFKEQQKTYHNLLRRQRADSFKKREEDRRALKLARQKEIEEYEASKKPYEDQLLLCNTLFTYLSRFANNPEIDSLPTTHHDMQTVAGEASLVAGMATHTPTPPPEGVAKVLIKSRTIEDVKVHKKRKKEKRRSTWAGKAIKHNPEVFAQFSSLDLNAPSTVGEVSSILKSLQDKKNHYEELAIAVSNAKALRARSSEESASQTEESANEESATTASSHQVNNLNLKLTGDKPPPPTLNPHSPSTPSTPSPAILPPTATTQVDDLSNDSHQNMVPTITPPQRLPHFSGHDTANHRSHNGGECNGNVLDDSESGSHEVCRQPERLPAPKLLPCSHNNLTSSKLEDGLLENGVDTELVCAVDPNQNENGVLLKTC